MAIPLLVTVTATFVDDGAGGTVARAQMGPDKQRDNWTVNRITTVTNNTTAVHSNLQVYQNAEGPSTYLDGSFNADRDVSQLAPPLEIGPGEHLLFVWTKGQLGNIATATITGILS